MIVMVIIMKVISKIVLVVSIFFVFLSVLFVYYYKDELYYFVRDEIIKEKDNITISKNDYFKAYDYEYLKNTNDFIAKDKNHLFNILYTILNSGSSSFTFYCNTKYKECLQDFKDITDDEIMLSEVNNFIHPYNSFKKLNISYNNYGKITINVIKNYTLEEIDSLNKRVKEIIALEIKDNMKTVDKIRAIHNYIINNSNYPSDEMIAANDKSLYNKATSNLLNKFGICSGYSDSMALFLYEFGVNNIKVSTTSHIWNLVYVDDTWLHLDLTWDDPKTSDGKDRLEILYFLVTSSRLKEIDGNNRIYNTEIYKEAR